MAVVGVDEAGKGPVLGSMFAAAVRWPDDAAFPAGLVDSKQLTPERRDALDAAIRDADGVSVALAEVPVADIDDPETDMNALTVEAHAAALTDVARPGDRVRSDAADVDPGRFARRLAESAGIDGSDVRAEHRADEHHAVVSAASVVAKVARDAHVTELAADYGDVGSGYPSDPATQAFLERYVAEHGGLPDCARASWATSQRVLAAAEQAGLGEF
jgi:ribonuclease HII